MLLVVAVGASALSVMFVLVMRSAFRRAMLHSVAPLARQPVSTDGHRLAVTVGQAGELRCQVICPGDGTVAGRPCAPRNGVAGCRVADRAAAAGMKNFHGAAVLPSIEIEWWDSPDGTVCYAPAGWSLWSAAAVEPGRAGSPAA